MAQEYRNSSSASQGQYGSNKGGLHTSQASFFSQVNSQPNGGTKFSSSNLGSRSVQGSSSSSNAAPPPPPALPIPSSLSYAPTTTSTTSSSAAAGSSSASGGTNSNDAKPADGIMIRALRHLDKPNAPEFLLKKPGAKTFTPEALQNMILDAAWLETKVQAEKYALAKTRKKQPRRLTRLRYDAAQLASHYQISQRRLRDILRENREGRRKPLKKRGRPRKIKPGEVSYLNESFQ